MWKTKKCEMAKHKPLIKLKLCLILSVNSPSVTVLHMDIL